MEEKQNQTIEAQSDDRSMVKPPQATAEASTPINLNAVVEQISTTLNETEAKPVEQIKKIVAALGGKRAQKLLKRTLEIEENGGMPIYNEQRRRTIGGVFFFLAQRWVDKEHCHAIWPEMYPSFAPPLKWNERKPLIQQAIQQVGQINSARIVLIGRPGRVIEKERVVLASMQVGKHPIGWPKGLPHLPPETTPYVIYITAKHWRKVKPALRDKRDELVVEGYPVYNSQLQAMTVFSIRTTTKVLERTMRDQQRPAK